MLVKEDAMLENNDKYFEVLNDIKKTLITTRNKIVESANKNLVLQYRFKVN